MIGTWLVSLALKNASIVDITWGLGFVIVAWAVYARVDGNAGRQALLVTMTTLWGLRLALHLFIRNHGKGEDFRYRAMRKRWGPRFPLISLATVFTVQGVLMWIVSLPVQLGQVSASPDLGLVAWIGVAVWAIGLFFEVVGDAQLARFKKDPANSGMVMQQRSVAVHPASQLLRRCLRVVGHRPGCCRDQRRSLGTHRCRRDDVPAPPCLRGDVAGEVVDQAQSGLRRVRGPHRSVRPTPSEAAALKVQSVPGRRRDSLCSSPL